MSIRYIAGRITDSINPLRVPNAPASATATASTATTASVAFTAPTDVGGSAVTSYSAVATTGGTVFTSATSPISVTGLSPSTSYTFQVAATNSYGIGPVLLSNTITTAALSWLSSLVNSGSNADGRGIAVDTSGNVYLNGWASGAFYYGATVKLSNTASLTWQKFLRQTASGTFCLMYQVAVDSSGNVYNVGYENGNSIWVVVKYNSSGVLQWKKNFTTASNQDQAHSIVIDSSSNIYIVGQGTPNYPEIYLLKIDTSGNLTWQTKLGLPASNYTVRGRGVAVDTSGNVYVCGYGDTNAGTGTIDIVVAKYNSSGTLQWQRSLYSSTNDYAYEIAVDSSANVYVCGQTSSGGGSGGSSDCLLAKWDTSGTYQWQRSLYTSGAVSDVFNSIAIDSSDNIYLAGYAASTDGLLAKYNSSGTLQWQRRIYDSSGGYSTQLSGIAVSGTTLYFTGSKGESSGNSIFSGQVPTDGTKTGTYTLNGLSVTYAASSLISATPSLTASSPGLTSSAGAGTWSAAATVESDGTLLSYTVSL